MQKHKSISIIFIISLVFYFSQNISAQKETKKWKKNLVFGGNIGLQIGSATRIDLSPEVGYKITEDLTSGVGITYQYYSYSLNQYNFRTSLYGGKVFTRYFFLENVFGQIEYEVLSLETDFFDPLGIHGDVNRFWLQSLFVGGGYKQPIGKKSAFIITVLWNLNDIPESPYSNPIIRIGFVF